MRRSPNQPARQFDRYRGRRTPIIAATVLLLAVVSGLTRPGSAAQVAVPPLAASEPARLATESLNGNPSQPAPVAAPSWSSEAAVTPQQIDGVAAAYAVDITHDVELFAQNPDLPLPPASTTKMITALTTLRFVTLDEEVVVDAEDLVDTTVYSNMALLAGDRLSVDELLAGLLIQSAGDAASALARYVGEKLSTATAADDPRKLFVDEMNALARELGMRSSTFLNPDGRDEPGHLSSARDLALAAQALFEIQALQEMVAARTWVVEAEGPNARQIQLWTTNELLGSEGVHGVKTGTTDSGGQCLIAATWRGDSRVLTIVLGSADRYASTREVWSEVDNAYRWLRFGRDGDLPGLVDQLAARGLSMAISVPVVLTTQQASSLRFEIETRDGGGGDRWSAAGVVQFFVGDTPLLRLPLYAGDPTVQP